MQLIASRSIPAPAGQVVGPLYAVGGLEVGYRGAGVLDGDDGVAVVHQGAQIEGHGLMCGQQCLVSAGLGPRVELLPSGGVGPASAGCLGVPDSGCDGLGRILVALRQFRGLLDPCGGG